MKKRLKNLFKKRLSIFQQYQNMVDETNIVSKTDIHGIITYVNKKFLDTSGYTEDELIGKPHNVVRDPNMPSEVFRKMWETIRAKKSWHGIVTNRKKDGGTYTVEASIFPILNKFNEIVEYISIRHDITKMIELNNKLDEINNYKIQQEKLAKDKLEAGIVNDLGANICETYYKPSDIVSGDFYSTYKMNNGSIFMYVIDGQGHGVSPALTVFAISSILKQVIYDTKSMKELITRLYPDAKNFLGDYEQLSYTMVMISPDKKTITYSAGGMYPFLIKTKDEIIKVKSNNMPFMNFSPVPTFETINIDDWDSITLFSDGIMEHEHDNLEDCIPENIIKDNSSIDKAVKKISLYDFEDDVTIVHLKNT